MEPVPRRCNLGSGNIPEVVGDRGGPHEGESVVAVTSDSSRSSLIRKVLTHLGKPLEPPPIFPARGPPTDWGELVQVDDDWAILQASPVELPDIDIRSL